MRKICFLLALACVAFIQSVAAQSAYKFIKEIPLPGDAGWDYLSIDAQARRLYVTHGDKIVVLDLDKDAVVGEIADTPGVHGFALAAEIGRGFSSNGAEDRVSVVDLKTLKTIAKIKTGKKPDAIVYEPKHAEVFVFNGLDNSATVFDAKKLSVTSTIALGGRPEFAVRDANSGRVYCNLEDTNEVASIDTVAHKVIARWSLAPAETPTGLAIDRPHHRLFAGCRKLMMMMDSQTGKVLATLPIGAGVDACEFEDATQLVFASCGSGTVTIAKEETPDKLNIVQTLETKPGARTMALDPKTRRIYLATADFKMESVTPSSPPAGAATRPARVPGTFRILIYGPE